METKTLYEHWNNLISKNKTMRGSFLSFSHKFFKLSAPVNHAFFKPKISLDKTGTLPKTDGREKS